MRRVTFQDHTAVGEQGVGVRGRVRGSQAYDTPEPKVFAAAQERYHQVILLVSNPYTQPGA